MNDIQSAGAIRILRPDDPAWSALAGSHPAASLFHHPAWQQALSECYGYPSFVLALASRDGALDAALPVLDVRSWLTGRRLIALPFSDYCPALAADESALPALARDLTAVRKASRLARIEVRGAMPEGPGVHVSTEQVLHTLPLAAGLESVLAGCSSKCRQYIRKAEREGMQCAEDGSAEALRTFYALHLKTRHKLGVPIQPWRFFQVLWNRILRAGLGGILLVSREGQPVSAAIVLAWNGKAMIKFSATDPAHLQHRAHYFLFSKCIEWAVRRGCSQIDFGRTETAEEGLRFFKSSWGAAETILPYSTFSELPPRPHGRRAETLLRKIIRTSPPAVCRLLGALLYRHVA